MLSTQSSGCCRWHRSRCSAQCPVPDPASGGRCSMLCGVNGCVRLFVSSQHVAPAAPSVLHFKTSYVSPQKSTTALNCRQACGILKGTFQNNDDSDCHPCIRFGMWPQAGEHGCAILAIATLIHLGDLTWAMKHTHTRESRSARTPGCYRQCFSPRDTQPRRWRRRPRWL